MFSSLFEFLFKYRPTVFEQGEFALSATRPVSIAVAAAGLAALATVLAYRRARGDSRLLDRFVLAGLRIAALALLLFCLVRPILILKAAVPQQNFVAVLLDDSRSMRIADHDEGEPRSAFIAQQLGSPSAPLLAGLTNRFVVRTFRFSSTSDSVPNAAVLSYTGGQTRLGEALRRARDELAGLPVAGLVVLSDGADTSEATLRESLLTLKAESLPVFTVGIGRETIAPDIQVSRVAAPRSVLKDSSLEVEVVLSHHGFEGRTVPLQIEDAGRIVNAQEVALPDSEEPITVRARFTAAEPGPRVFRFRVPPQAGETISQNNAREVLIEVEDRRDKILYFEGEPRFEVKFVRRAIADDKNIQLVVLQRTADNKYLRLDVDQPEELASGFPKTREELFSYRGLILGSIEAAAFAPEQLRMIADFVNLRGGGLLMLGGRRSFAEGDYGGTPVAEVLPVILETPSRGASPYLARLDVQPTRPGSAHPVLQLAGTDRASAARWAELPGVTSVNPIRRAKPGATVLLMGNEGRRTDQIVLAWQRYGRGKALALPVQDTWNWQLNAKVAVEDMSHETFWRQMLRWLVDAVPDRVSVTASPDRVDPGDRVTLVADVNDAAFAAINNARVLAQVTSPSGKIAEVPLEWSVGRDGEYRASFTADEEGPYDVRLEAARDGGAVGTGRAHVRAVPGEAEYFDAGMRPQLLRRVAEETGGRYYTPQTAAALPEDISHTGRGVTIVEERELWDMPALLVALLGLVLGEWTYRRARGLA